MLSIGDEVTELKILRIKRVCVCVYIYVDVVNCITGARACIRRVFVKHCASAPQAPKQRHRRVLSVVLLGDKSDTYLCIFLGENGIAGPHLIATPTHA